MIKTADISLETAGLNIWEGTGFNRTRCPYANVSSGICLDTMDSCNDIPEEFCRHFKEASNENGD